MRSSLLFLKMALVVIDASLQLGCRYGRGIGPTPGARSARIRFHFVSCSRTCWRISRLSSLPLALRGRGVVVSVYVSGTL